MPIENKVDKIRITLVRSVISCNERQVRTVKALGLRKIGHSVVRDDTAQVRGMAAKVSHLVKLETV